MSVDDIDPAFETLLEYLRNNRGFDFGGYKRTTLVRRVQRRMADVGAADFGEYIDYLEVYPHEFELLFNTILINVSSFFRDAAAWQYLAQEIIPQVIERSRESAQIRAWSAGCASGEEAYSLAILFAEALGLSECRTRLKIYATDVDEAALLQARQAAYDPRSLNEMPEALRDKYFEFTAGHYVFRSELRRSVIFGQHDLLQDAPISRLDILMCRNTLIYFNQEAQRVLIPRFHFALKDTGYLFLGKAEMLLTYAHLFAPLHARHRIFTKVQNANLREQIIMLAEASDLDSADRLQKAALNELPVPYLIVDRRDRLAMCNARARSILGLHVRDVGRQFQDLEISYRPVELRSLIDRARREQQSIHLTDVERSVPQAPSQYFDVEVTALREESGAFCGTGIAFVDVTQRHELRQQLQQTQQEIETVHEELQSTNEELETSNEELQSTIEELQTTNEELQSTNQEMETMNEELQSANEELQAMNDELHDRTFELDKVNAFLNSILSTVNVGVVVLDRNLRVALWNKRARDMWGLRSEEAQGQPFLDLDIGLPVSELENPLRELLRRDDGSTDTSIMQAFNRLGKPITVQVARTLRHDESGEAVGLVLLIREESR